MAQILMFIILGLLSFPGQLFTMDIMLNGLVLSVILILIARPIAVFISTIKMNYTLKEKTFLSWAGLRGAVPIVLFLIIALIFARIRERYFTQGLPNNGRF